MQKSKVRFLAAGLVLVAAAAVVLGVLQSKTELLTVSSTVNGRELPVYCVDTQEKKVALSFDAAWGNGYLREKEPIINEMQLLPLKILIKI